MPSRSDGRWPWSTTPADPWDLKRCRTGRRATAALQLFSGRRIDVPACFIAGKSDWGTYQAPGAFEVMRTSACSRMLGCHLLPGAGHWVQQEQPQETGRWLLEFLRQVDAGAAPSAGSGAHP